LECFFTVQVSIDIIYIIIKLYTYLPNFYVCEIKTLVDVQMFVISLFVLLNFILIFL
jgi:hypothetical protein